MRCSRTNPSPPPWEALLLVAHHLDLPSLAKASCVSKSWSLCFSSDHLWGPLCTTQFPSLSTLHAASPGASIPYRRLYSLGVESAKRRIQKPPEPRLSLHNLLFAVEISSGNHHVTIVKPCGELGLDPDGLFRFDIDASSNGEDWSDEALNGVKIAWHVVVKGWKGVFTMMEREGKGSVEGWFSEELPAPGCCSSTTSSGLVADLRLWVGGSGVVEKVSVGVLSVVCWRFVCVDDVLGYLQHFLPV